ncbi:hypothetical protein ABE438_04235 [Bosea sp. TWI1241]|uniref:hypothetical protein n=1 Tax=Bosea sp. TWI1241 TaxID=3148904 RepID=UPI003209460C
MSRSLRLLGFALSFVTVTAAVGGQLTGRPSVVVAAQLDEGQARIERPSRVRVGRIAETRKPVRLVWEARA